MLGGLKLLLDRSVAVHRRPTVIVCRRSLKKSRDAQAAVSTALAEQVLGALHELLRGWTAPIRPSSANWRGSSPDHLYEGLLTVLMRLVFILYAEDRDLMPSRTDGGRGRSMSQLCRAGPLRHARRGRRAQSRHDGRAPRRLGPPAGAVPAGSQGAHERTSFRRVAASCSIRTSSRSSKDERPRTSPRRIRTVSDGCILRILDGLMTLKVRGGERERLSYRTLDVEQIGIVYETVMGFTVETRPRAGARDQGWQERPHAGLRRSRRARWPRRARTGRSS